MVCIVRCKVTTERGRSKTFKDETEKWYAREHLQRCHVIEGMVQLLTNGLVLELLSIQFIWRSEVDRKRRQVSSAVATQKQERNERQRQRQGGEDKRQVSFRKDADLKK